jgi:hypothetical protein
MGGASSPSFFVKAFYLDKLPSVGSVFPNFVPQLRKTFLNVDIGIVYDKHSRGFESY